MLEITITGAAPYDGTYQVDMDVSFNGRELHLIKKVSGVRLGEIDEALQAGDYDVFVAFAAIALTRAGKVEREKGAMIRAADVLMEAEAGKILVENKAEPEAEAVPLEPPPTEPEQPASPSESSERFSADSSPIGDDRPATTLASIGSRS